MTRLSNKVLVIDEMPVVRLGLQEVFKGLNEEVTVAHAENIFTVLGSPAYDQEDFDLVVAGPPNDGYASEILQPISELRQKFPHTKILLYAETYDPSIIEKMKPAGVDAYVHKYEGIEEVRKAYLKISENEPYISPMFHTLYFQYGMTPAFLQRRDDMLIQVNDAQRQILLQLCRGKAVREIADYLQRPEEEVVEQISRFVARL